MSEYIGVVTNAGQIKIAAAIGGTALNLTTIRVGDGNGAPIVPNPAMTDLVRRVGAAYPIVSSGRDPVNANHWRVTALIPVDDGPFDIREIGVWDAAGDMIAVARHVLVEKRTPAQGAAVELLTDIVFPVSETAQVTVLVTPSAQISIFQMLRAGFMVVESATLADPPGAPALGRTHVVPAGATGSWVGLAGMLVQWNGTVWVAVTPPEGHIVVDNSKALGDATRWMRRTAAGWVSGGASETAYGVTRHATIAETRAGQSNLISVTPAGLAATVRRRLNANLTVYVRSDGNDANDGSSNTAASAFATIQGAVNRVAQIYDTAGYTITIQLGLVGTYAGTVVPSNIGTVIIQGSSAAAAGYIITPPAGSVAPFAVSGGFVRVKGFKLRATSASGTPSACAQCQGGLMIVEDCYLDATTQSTTHDHLIVGTGGRLITAGFIELLQSARSFVQSGGGGSFASGNAGSPPTTVYPASANFSGAFCIVSSGYAEWSNTIFSGSAIGPRFLAAANGTIQSYASGTNYLPGSTAGSELTGGRYV